MAILHLFSRLLAVRERFVARHLAIALSENTKSSGLTRVWIRSGWFRKSLIICGRGGPGTVAVSLADDITTLDLPAPNTAFRLEVILPRKRRRLVTISVPDGPYVTLRRCDLTRAHALLTVKFLRILFVILPDIISWYRFNDLGRKAKIKKMLGFDDAPLFGPVLSTQLERGEQVHCTTSHPVILLPVFGAFDLLAECLKLIEAHTRGDWSLVCVEDASSDPRILPLLREFSLDNPNRVSLTVRTENGGFIEAVNDGFDYIRCDPTMSGRPVILLNTDAFVPEGWDTRLTAPLADPDVASVTPMSNDAEIFTVPVTCVPTKLALGQADAIDAVARTLPNSARAFAPTGVGFCMALSRRFLDQVPRFDTVFGRGYGEEVDWCQKVRALGGKHVATAQLFVEHRGGQSFGSAEKQRLIQQNSAYIRRRYPQYDTEIQDFILEDPLRTPRLLLAMAWAETEAETSPVPIYLAHSMGGGADHWLQNRVSQDAEAGLPSVIIRVGGPATWQVEVKGIAGTTGGYVEDFEVVRDLLSPLSRRRIIYSCGVGATDPAELPERLLSLAGSPYDSIEVLFHDYLPISPSFTLVGGDGRYHGPISPERLADIPKAARGAHEIRRPSGDTISLAEWQAAWGQLLEAAAEVRVFSDSSKALIAATWPDLADRILVAPHAMQALPATIQQDREVRESTLGILGNIAPHKGARLVQSLARMDKDKRGGGMVLVGNIDPSYALPRKCRVHGDYKPADIPDLARHYGVTHWLIPSIWPETFSFTTHEAIATGLPVMAFDIGAQGDAVRAAPNGIPLPYDPDANLTQTVLDAFRKVPQPYTKM